MGEGGERATSTGNIATGNLEEMGCRETPGQQGCAEKGDREACIQSTGQHKEKKKTETQRERNVPWWGRKHCCMRARESRTENEDAGSITGNITEKKKENKKAKGVHDFQNSIQKMQEREQKRMRKNKKDQTKQALGKIGSLRERFDLQSTGP